VVLHDRQASGAMMVDPPAYTQAVPNSPMLAIREGVRPVSVGLRPAVPSCGSAASV
jgi:hypothetical protein